MADQEEAQDQQDQLASNIGWFVVGTVVGMAAALLLAPQSGKKTREFLAEKTQQSAGAVADTGKDIYDRSKDMIDQGRQLVEDAAGLIERGRKLVRGV